MPGTLTTHGNSYGSGKGIFCSDYTFPALLMQAVLGCVAIEVLSDNLLLNIFFPLVSFFRACCGRRQALTKKEKVKMEPKQLVSK